MNPSPSRRSVLSTVAAVSAAAIASKVMADDATTKPAETKTLPDGLKYTDVTEPSPGAKTGDTVWVHYVLTLKDGKEIDNSYKRGEPIQVTLGQGQVIKGWEEGLIGMQVGGKRKLEIPPELAYGSQDHSGIPGNSTLFFDTEMMGVKR